MPILSNNTITSPNANKLNTLKNTKKQYNLTTSIISMNSTGNISMPREMEFKKNDIMTTIKNYFSMRMTKNTDNNREMNNVLKQGHLLQMEAQQLSDVLAQRDIVPPPVLSINKKTALFIGTALTSASTINSYNHLRVNSPIQAHLLSKNNISIPQDKKSSSTITSDNYIFIHRKKHITHKNINPRIMKQGLVLHAPPPSRRKNQKYQPHLQEAVSINRQYKKNTTKYSNKKAHNSLDNSEEKNNTQPHLLIHKKTYPLNKLPHNIKNTFYLNNSIDDRRSSSSPYTTTETSQILLSKNIEIDNDKPQKKLSHNIKRRELVNEGEPIDCRDVSHSPSYTDIMRVVSRVISQPVESGISYFVDDDGSVAHFGTNCPQITENKKKMAEIERFFRFYISMIPSSIATAIIISDIASAAIEYYADLIDGKTNIDFCTVFSSKKNILSNLITALLSSVNLLIKPASIIKKNTLIGKMAIKNISIEDDKIYIKLAEEQKKEVIIKWGRFIDKETNTILYYNKENHCWSAVSNVKATHLIRDAYQKAIDFFKDKTSTLLYLNESPLYYHDGVLVYHDKKLYTYVDGHFLETQTIEIAENVYRYIASDPVLLREFPLNYRYNGWTIEPDSSPMLSDGLLNTINISEKYTQLKPALVKNEHVTPMMLSDCFQYDKDKNAYIKINNKYFLVKKDLLLHELYIDGELSYLPIYKKKNKYYLKEHALQHINVGDKEKVTTLNGHRSDQYYLSRSLINRIEERAAISVENRELVKITTSHIPGAISYLNKDYIVYKYRWLEVISFDDDTYAFKVETETENEHLIYAYKNQYSNTYQLIESRDELIENAIKSNERCITKRDVFSGCKNIRISEQLSSYIESNIDYAISMDDISHLEPDSQVPGFYRDKNNHDKYYFHYKQNIFFNAAKITENNDFNIPCVFYLKEPVGHPRKFTCNLAIIKDFDKHQNILCTHKEACDMITIDTSDFNQIRDNRLFEDKIIKKRMVNPHIIDRLFAQGVLKKNTIRSVQEHFLRYGKTAIYSLEETQRKLNIFLRRMTPRGFLHRMSPLDIASPPYFSRSTLEVMSHAKKNTIDLLHSAILNIEDISLNPIKKSQIHHLLELMNIQSETSKEIMIDSLQRKMKRMLLTLDNDDNSNIILISKLFRQYTLEEHGLPLAVYNHEADAYGFVIYGDPLQRIFLNTEFISSEVLNNQKFNFYSNLYTDTILHESSHTAGSSTDIYSIPIGKNGKINDLTQIPNLINKEVLGETISSEVMLLSQAYLLENPYYRMFSLKELLTPHCLRAIYANDDLYAALLIIDNADTISALIHRIGLLPHV